MNLIQRLKIWKELRRLEQRVREVPSPSTFVDLGQVYINLGMLDKAVAAAADGLALFPDSVELAKLRDFSTRSLHRHRIDDLRARLAKAPSGRVYRDLAGIYLDLGDQGSLHSVCEEWSVRFPQDPGAWLVLGQAKLGNYYRDLGAREGIEAVESLKKVVSLDPQERKARCMLAELLYRIGATRLARGHLDVIRSTDDADLQALRHVVHSTPALSDDVPALLAQVEDAGVLPNAPPTAPRAAVRDEEGIGTIRDALAAIAELQGVQKATYIRGSRALVKGEIKDGKDAFLRIVRVVARASQRFVRRLDIGNFNKGVLAGPFGHICICCYGEVTAAVQCDATAPIDRLLAELQELVAGSLYLSTGGTK